MPTLYLHVGAGKTGTSFLQAQCALQSEKLAENGLWYPVTDQLLRRVRAGKVTSGNAGPLLPWFCPQHSRVRAQGLSLTEKQVITWIEEQDSSADGRDILLSSEALQFAKSDRVRLFAEIVTNRGYEVQVIFYGRHALDHATSNYREHLQRGMLSGNDPDGPPSLDNWIAKNVVPFAHTLGIYSQILSDSCIIVKSYDCAKSQLLTNFLVNMGIHGLPEAVCSTKTDCPVINRSLSVIETRYLELASSALSSAQIAYLGSLLVATPPCDAATKDPRWFRISSASLDSFERRHAKAFADINSRWSGSLGQPLEVIPTGFVNDTSEVRPESLLEFSLHALALGLLPSGTT